ncbi:hypothetical protein EFP17_08070 [Burkholderia glumae]|nr:hypothetical protein EFP17_08070 [Burkholderia glumae]
MLPTEGNLAGSFQDHRILSHKVVADSPLEIGVTVAGVLVARRRDDNVSLSVPRIIKGKAIFRELLVRRELTFQFTIDFETADDVLIDLLTHAAANDENLATELHQAPQVGSASSHRGPNS